MKPRRVIAVIVVALVLVGLLVYSQQRTAPLKVSGFIEADEIRIGSRVGGRVKVVHVTEGQDVPRGTLLLELEPYDLDAQLAETEAQLAQKQAVLEKLQHGYRVEEKAQAEQRVKQFGAELLKLKNGPRVQEIEVATANLSQAKFQFDLAVSKQRRAESLLAKDALTQDEMDQANSELRVARAASEARQAELSLLEAGSREEDITAAEARLKEAEEVVALYTAGFRKEEIAEAAAAVRAAEAARETIRQRLQELQVTTPVDGTVEAIELQPGDLVSAGSPAISLLDTRHLWVRAYLPENHLQFKLGHKVDVTVDSFPGKSFAGHLIFVSRAAEFTPGNVQTPEERSKQVFRIKVALDNGHKDLRPGMAADVWLEGLE